MAVGRISGPLLAQNLFRDNIPLAFYNTASTDLPVLYLDVENGLVGIRTSAPTYELDVAGYVNAQNLRVVQTAPGTGQGQIGNLLFAQSNIGSTIDDIIITPAALQSIVLNAATTATGVFTAASGVESWSTNTGSIIVLGGQGIQGNLFIGGITNIHSSATSISTDTGALVVGGGVGVGGSIFAGGDGNFGGTLIVGSTATVGGSISVAGTSTFTGIAKVRDNTQAYSTGSGAFIVEGGVGIGNDLWVGGTIHGKIEISSVTNITTNADRIKVTNTLTDVLLYPMLANTIQGYADVDTTATITYRQDTSVLTVPNLTITGNTVVGSTTTDTIIFNAGVASNIIPTAPSAFTIGSETDSFYRGFIDKLYSNVLGNQQGDINVNPASGMFQVNGDIRVKGTNPIGTAPVVTNILYVTMDGDDTNDGRAMDPSRACRTVGAALNSPYYQSGTQIRVAPGRYLENNPLQLKPYTSIVGSDLRTTSIEAINKTQDLFHLNSGCYLAFMQFLNGRSGLLPGNDYANGYNRGAYCTAFPPLPEGERIDLFHSPYVQNCTNLTGPWLKDGTMFVPDQTVQVPTSVGTGTWAYNTTTIIVQTSLGIPELGDTINPGQQNPGFFNARSLMLANKPFLQAQVASYIQSQILANLSNPGSIWYNFSTNYEISYRDAGILIENVAYDAAFGGNQQSREAGLAYWNGVVSYIATSIPQCIEAINYLSTLTQQVITNTTCTVLPLVANIPVASQVINTVLVNGGVASSSITSLFNSITNVIANGPDVAPALYTSPGPDAAFVSAEILMQANRQFIQENTLNYINWNLVEHKTPTYLPYNKIKCSRDTGIVIDSIAADLLYPTASYSQTTFAGLQYYAQGGYTGNIPSEITTTTAAVSYLQKIALKVIQNITPEMDAVLGIQRFSASTQLTNYQPGTAVEVATLTNEFNIILSILQGNTKGWTDQVIANKAASNLLSVQDSYNLLLSNLSYMQDEVYAYITSPAGLNYDPSNYNVATCMRDVGYIINSVAFDLLHGGNRQAIQSGLSYYIQNPAKVLIPGETTATSAAFNFLGTVINTLVTSTNYTPYQTKVAPVTTLPLANVSVLDNLSASVSTLTNVISNGPAGYEFTPISLTASSDVEVQKAYEIINANRAFLTAEVTAWIDYTYNSVKFQYTTATCYRDTGLIIDAIGMDLLYNSTSDSTFTGLQYWNQDVGFTGNITNESTATLAAIHQLELIALSYVTTATYATLDTLATLLSSTLNLGPAGITNKIVFGGLPTTDVNILADVATLQSNIPTMQSDIISWITSTYPDLVYDTATCQRDVGYIINAFCFDLINGGNAQTVKAAVYYYGYDSGSIAIPNEISQTTAAYNYISNIVSNIVTGTIISSPYQTAVQQYVGGTPATLTEATTLTNNISVITNIINNGPAAAGDKTPQSLTENTDPNVINAWTLLHANRAFIQAEVIAYIEFNFKTQPFQYDQAYCYRDIGLMVDAVSQDILLGGNQKSIEAGLSYWNQGYNYIANEVSTTTAAINYISEICRKIIANQPVDVVTGTNTVQVINTFFQYGDDYMPQEAVARNFNIISNIIANGPLAAPIRYAGGGLFALTGVNGADVKIAPTVTYISTITEGTYLIGLSKPTVGFGNNATLYFGKTYVFPLQDTQVEALSLEYTGNADTWNERKVDAIGAMGGSLVDGGVISARSPINSFVYDAFTQIAQGGIGIHITNNGYAQLVSVFTVFCSIAVLVDKGGIASIVNSNCNFGDLCLVAKGYGTREFSGTVYNPKFRAYPFSPADQPGSNGLDPYYPAGFWPNKRSLVEVFVPDLGHRPHISLLMEVVPPSTYINPLNSDNYAEKGLYFSGFLVAKPSTGTLIPGAITLTGIDTTDIAIGHTLQIVDQFGSPYDQFPYIHDDFGNYLDASGNITTTASNYISNPNYGIWYAATGTVVVDLNFDAITLNKALTSGGNFSNDPNYFNLYFCGNNYYTVLTSEVADQPYKVNTNILSANTDPFYQGPNVDQVAAHVASINHLKTVVDKIIDNQTVTPTTGNTATQFISAALTGGAASQTFIDLSFGYLTNIVGSADIAAAQKVVPAKFILKTGTPPSGAGSAITLIQDNTNFLTEEILAYVNQYYSTEFNGTTMSDGQASKCARDVKLILQQLIYDLESGGNYNMVYAGLSYWSRPGSYHIVEVGESITDPSLFPDGAIVNFYQRSYMSASGYVFEYVGAGSNYGALPQNGIADPIQARETVQLDYGKVFFTSTDQNGDFRIGPALVISQATGVISGRTFTQSLFANMTPFILAIEGL